MTNMVATADRSLVLPTGLISATADGRITFNPSTGRENSTWLPVPATVLMAYICPKDTPSRLVVGDASGTVATYTLPLLHKVDESKVSNSPITALALHESSGGSKLLVGDERGGIHALGEDIPGGCLRLFQVGRKVDIIRTECEQISLYMGWDCEIRHWNGDISSPPRKPLTPPNPPVRRVRQERLSLGSLPA